MKATLQASRPRPTTMKKRDQWHERVRGEKEITQQEERQGDDSDRRKDKCEGQRRESQYWEKVLKKRTNKLIRNAGRPKCQYLMFTANQKKPTDNCQLWDTLEMKLLNSRINKKSQVFRANKQVIYERGRKICLDSAFSAPPDTKRQ